MCTAAGDALYVRAKMTKLWYLISCFGSESMECEFSMAVNL